MTTAANRTFQLTDPALFFRKVTAVFAATLVLVPLVYFKLSVPAWLYVSLLLLIHLTFLYTYFAKMPWRDLTQHKAGFGLRVLAVGFFIYLLAVLKFQGSISLVLLNLLAGLVIHSLILFSLMVEYRPKQAQRRVR